MQLSLLDWIIVLGYLAFSLGVGIYYSKRAGESPEEYYLAGRTLPWWILGTSMVATTFAADTPLAITEMSRTKGIWENWFWWNWLLYGLLAVFLFSRLWRRANILTENELLEMRYSGKPAAFLRIFKAGYFAILYNFIVMGWVILGMSSVLTVMLFDGPSNTAILGAAVPTQYIIIAALCTIATLYALLSGFWGVVVTDVVQFVISIVGAVALAVIALNHVGGMESLLSRLDESLTAQAAANEAELDTLQGGGAPTVALAEGQSVEDRISELKVDLAQSPRNAEEAINFIPPLPPELRVGTTSERMAYLFSADFLNSAFFQFTVLILVMWWSNHSTDGGGYLAQRTMAAKNEKHAMAANLWYNFANFALRTWPWIMVALVSMVLYPDLSGNEIGEKAGYPLVMKQLLGSGMRGLLLVSFLAAFMSTIDTHLNWGSSYLVHDVYRRFMNPSGTEAHYVTVGRIITLVMMVVAAVLATQMGSIEKAWKFVMAMGGGIGLVLILRWFWWRINAWSEIAAMATSVTVTLGFEVRAAMQTKAAGGEYVLFGSDPQVAGHPFPFHLQLLVIVFLSLIAWISATYLTKPEPEEKLREFYARVQPGGWWGPIAGSVPQTMAPVSTGFVSNFIAGLAFVWGGTFCIGYMCFLKWGAALGMALIMLGGFGWIWVNCIQRIEN